MKSSNTAGRPVVAVFGLGYVGCVTAACLAELGYKVIGVDRDDYKVRSILAGSSPFYEPGLPELVRRNVASGTLSACITAADALHEADIALLCVGTPSERNGNLGLEQLRRVSDDIARRAAPSRSLIVAVRSTVFPGTCEEVVMPVFEGHPGVRVVSNPEFLREGAAVQDFMEPSLIVVGGEDVGAVSAVAALYAPLKASPCLVSLRTAEAIKYACNAFHAVKVTFANEVGTLCASLGVSGREVMDTLCRDERLNISPAYLKPGFAFGGSCLPKDVRALAYRASRLDLKLPLLESVLPGNEEHLRRAIRAVMELPARRLGIFGLAFKENTDDLRESSVVALIEHLIGKGRELRVFDPHIRLDEIYGSNRNFILSAVPHVGRLVDSKLEGLLEWADHIVLAQKPDMNAARQIAASGLPVIDLVGSGWDRGLAASGVHA